MADQFDNKDAEVEANAANKAPPPAPESPGTGDTLDDRVTRVEDSLNAQSENAAIIDAVKESRRGGDISMRDQQLAELRRQLDSSTGRVSIALAEAHQNTAHIQGMEAFDGAYRLRDELGTPRFVSELPFAIMPGGFIFKGASRKTIQLNAYTLGFQGDAWVTAAQTDLDLSGSTVWISVSYDRSAGTATFIQTASRPTLDAGHIYIPLWVFTANAAGRYYITNMPIFEKHFDLPLRTP